ncbi:hypothetical protein NHQ30_002667 [Ciborinia camelliae]|nr:hypothetical protein NHQ30_002667 [Ciborinia camelliae]
MSEIKPNISPRVPEISDLELVEGKVSRKGIPLRPQPTNDPNDPLNWSFFEKYTTYITICFMGFLVVLGSSSFIIAIVPVAKELHTTTVRAGYLTSIHVLAMGIGNIIWVPLSRRIGKRPVYLSSLLLLVGTKIWGYFARSYVNLLASRIVDGLVSGAAEATIPSVVADLFYFHERGHCMMLFHIAISAGIFLGPLINGYIVEYAGWRWMMGFLAILAATTFVIGIFTIHETAYPREKAILSLPENEYPPKRSRLSDLSLSIGYNPDASPLKWLRGTLTILAYPPILIVSSTLGVCVGCIGLLSISGFIGAIISFFIAGRLIDIIATRMTTRLGHPEPEFRLPAMIFPAVIGPMGILTFALVIAFHKPWIGAAVGFAMIGFGFASASNVLVTYAVDAYRPA